MLKPLLLILFLSVLGATTSHSNTVAHTQSTKTESGTMRNIRTLQVPTDMSGYKKLFVDYMDDSIERSNLSKILEKKKIKLKIIENEINNTKNSTARVSALQNQFDILETEKKQIKKRIDTVAYQIKKSSFVLTYAAMMIQFDKKSSQKVLKSLLEKAASIRKDINKLKVDHQGKKRTKEQNSSTLATSNMIEYRNQLNRTIKSIVSNQFMLFAEALQSKEDSVFHYEEEIENQISLMPYASVLDPSVMSLLKQMEKEYFGNIATVEGSVYQEFKNILLVSWDYINKALFSINGKPISLLKLSIVVLIFFISFILGGAYKVKMHKMTINRKSLTSSRRTILANIGYYAIILAAFMISLNILGVNLSSITLLASALSVGIGFGLQNIVANFISGLILMFERSIKVGDYVQLDDSLQGHIVDMRMRTTTINTNKNIDVIIPNQNFTQNQVVNWTMNDDVRRFDIPFSVKYGTGAEEVMKLVEEAVKESGYGDIYSTPQRHTRVVMTAMADSGVNFELFVWIKGKEMLYPKRTVSRFLILIYNKLNENNIEIPYPQQDLHIRSIDDTIRIPFST